VPGVGSFPVIPHRMKRAFAYFSILWTQPCALLLSRPHFGWGCSALITGLAQAAAAGGQFQSQLLQQRR
jgi:hypothetical protein